MKKIYLLSILCFLSFLSFSQNPFKYKGFSGGMMVHTGFLKSNSFTLTNNQGNNFANLKVEGMPFGLGGAARLHFGNHWRIGGEGYVSDITYGRYNSINSISWGGILVDYTFNIKRFTPFVGVIFGGGSFQNITLTQSTLNDFITEENTSYRKHSFLAISPFIGIEYALTKKLHLTLKADYLMNINNPSNDFAKGVRLFFGVMFYRTKN